MKSETNFIRTTFILNPRSGTLGGKRSAIRLIDRIWGATSRDYKILVTTRKGEGTRLAREEADRGSDFIVAVGGDGTLNEIVKGVLGRDICVGIIPAGSGNGFARHWNIPLNLEQACEKLLNPKIVRCDVGMADDHLFMVTFGCGMDADLSDRYSRSTVRGIGSYFYHGVKAYFDYQLVKTIVRVNGEEAYSGNPLLLTFSNTRGYGGGAVIAPQAQADDGLLDLCVIHRLPFKEALFNLPNMFNGTIQRIPGYLHKQMREAVIERSFEGPIHVDGDPFPGGKEIHVKTLPQIVPLVLQT
jgi:YegS/Rv2252/BmrU family lipid kinase